MRHSLITITEFSFAAEDELIFVPIIPGMKLFNKFILKTEFSIYIYCKYYHLILHIVLSQPKPDANVEEVLMAFLFLFLSSFAR